MSDRRVHGLRRLTSLLTQSSGDLDSDALERETRDVGLVPIAELELRTRVTVRGEVRSVTLRPRVEVPALDVEIWDGTGALHLVWLGRRRIAGITPGTKLQATGRVTRQRNLTMIFNPAYEIVPRSGAQRA